ncbi:MAG: PAS domain-containing sensor histidine kinase [Deltaproteobacteria bacterium]|nr:PAS domain-containing sensor histidine kinase [Deltaproteobacteria bacterium]
MIERIAELEREIKALRKINRVLMERVEQSVDGSGDAFDLFERNILLEKHVEERTSDLEKARHRMARLLEKQRRISAELAENKMRLDQLAEQSRTVVWEIDSWGTFVYVSPVVGQVLGYRPEDLVGLRNIVDFEPASEDEPSALALRERIRAGEPFTGLVRIVQSSEGRRVWVSTNAIPRRDIDGEVVGYRGSDTDITERKAAEEALRESEARLKDLFENMPNGYYRSTVDGRFVDVNPAFVRMLGYSSRDELLRVDIARDLYVEPEERNRYLNGPNAEFLESSHFETYRLKTKDGRIIDIEDNARYVRDASGRVAFHEGICRDVTERKRAEEDRERLQGQLFQAQKMESVGILAGGVAHDFNNILQAMSGNVQFLLQGRTDDDPDTPRLRAVEKSVDRAAQLVRQLMLFSRKADIEKTRVDVNREVKGVMRMIERTIPRMITVECRLEPSVWPILADPVQVEQVLLNLAGNAADAMPDGGKLVIDTENVTADREFADRHLESRAGRYVLLSVSDTGCGMCRETIGHIFDPFFTTKEVGKGTGLGLASVYGIVKTHDGHIFCYSEEGKGTTFRIYWPTLEKDEARETAVFSGGSEIVSAQGAETILLVDDDEAIRELTSEALESLGYSILTAASGEEALAVMAERAAAVDLVVLDLGMPGMGGMQCLREVKRMAPEAKVLIASGYTLSGRDSEAVQAGAAGFIGKPYHLALLSAKIRSIIDGKPV